MSRRCCGIVRVANGWLRLVGVFWGGWNGIGSRLPSLAAGGGGAPRQTDLLGAGELGFEVAARLSGGRWGLDGFEGLID